MVDKCDGYKDCPNNYDKAASVCSKLKGYHYNFNKGKDVEASKG